MKFRQNLGIFLLIIGLVSCGGGSGGSDDHTTPAINKAPVVNAGADLSVDESAAVTLTGSASDSDGTIASYAWEQLSGPTITLTANNSAASGFTAPVTTSDVNIELRFSATDNAGAKTSDNVLVAVKAKKRLQTLAGRILSQHDNRPLTGARIKIGAQEIVSGSDGSYRLEGLNIADDRALINVTKAGYSEQQKVLANEHFHIGGNFDVHLQKNDLVVNVDIATSHVINAPDNLLSLTIPPAAFTYSDGSAANELVSLQLTIIDPRTQINAMPGDFTALDSSGTAETLKSYGAFQLQAQDSTGVPLRLNKAIDFEFMPLTNIGELPAQQTEFYQYDAVIGKWRKSLTSISRSDMMTYRGQVSALGSYNFGEPVQSFVARGCVTNKDNLPISGARISLISESVAMVAESYSDSLGKWELRIPEGIHRGLRADYSSTRSEVFILSASTGDQEYSDCLKLTEPVFSAQLSFNQHLPVAMPTVTYKSTTVGLPVVPLSPMVLDDLKLEELIAGFTTFDYQGRSTTNFSALKTGKGIFNYYVKYSERGFDDITAIEPLVVVNLPPLRHEVHGVTGRTEENSIWLAFSVDFTGDTPLFIAQNKWVSEIE